MLHNNDKVEWDDFKRKPIDIAQLTLSNNLSTLYRKGLIQKV